MKIVMRTIVISVIGLAVLGGAGYWLLQGLFTEDGKEIAEVAEAIEQREEGKASAETPEAKGAAGKVEADMDEERVQIYLHQMTHQKIVATEKRGAVEMSADNIDNMLKIVRANSAAYEHSAFYEETLTAWQQGDFSNAVAVHNTIWNWHKGTVGKATGLMSQAQEEAFVEKHFR